MDPSSLSNAASVRASRFHLDLRVDFHAQIIVGTVRFDFDVHADGTDAVVLDTSHLDIRAARLDNQPTAFTLGERVGALGAPLSVEIPEALRGHGSTFKLEIDYVTTDKCTALHWLRPEQTEGKRHPYLFSQLQAIHARSFFPCQDTPSVKMVYSATVCVPVALTALMSARTSETDEAATDGTRIFRFEQPVAIPSYLVALAVGDLENRRVGPRSRVWSEPQVVDAAAAELVDTEAFITIGEELTCPYEWGVYDVLVLPSSFPYGGMENPCLTFVSPSIIAGDRSLVAVVAHEIAHSWTGNLVTARTWEHFWLNEGFTVYLERRILARMYGEPARQFAAMIGRKDLEEAIRTHPAPLTALVPDLTGIDPDDAFSSVPYEKGFALLYHIETLVGGPDAFAPFLREYVARFRHCAITTADFCALVQDAFGDQLNDLDWQAWLTGPGLPPVLHAYDDSLATVAVALAERWTSTHIAELGALAVSTREEWASFSTDQRVYFFEVLRERPALEHARLAALDTAYALTGVRNSEVRFQWQQLCLRASYMPIFEHVIAFVTSVGRMKFVIPLYLALADANDAGKRLAVRTFLEERSFYHPIAAALLSKRLGAE